MKKLEKLIMFFLIAVLVGLNVFLFAVFFVFSDEDINNMTNFIETDKTDS